MITESQLKKIIREELLNELLTQKLQSLTIPALEVLLKNYTSHKEPEKLVVGMEDEDRIKERLIFVLNQEISADNRIKMEKEMSAWRWGWTRNANRATSDAKLSGQKLKAIKGRGR
jgi:hypothetical protein